ncbi:MAG: hypothetical protein NXI12_06820 [Alphaproteobacteria bacterium]|nr:hypothetical protein [Alphaproteobacteria bacterium]
MIVIAAFAGDIHSISVHLALRARGVRTVLVDFGSLPFCSITTTCNSGSAKIAASTRSASVELGEAEVIWNRRTKAPSFDGLDGRDREFAEREAEEFFHNFVSQLAHAIWVNPMSRTRSERSKIAQLNAASEFGLTTPETIISNDLDAIEQLLAEAPDEEFVCKPFTPASWHEGGALFELMTRPLDREALDAIKSGFLLPLIVQRRVEKREEVRVTCFGRHQVAVAIASQRFSVSSVDWRHLHPRHLTPKAIEIPPEIASGIERLMRRLDIVFGCFDFIIDQDGCWVFLEVNPQGQFLFLEEALPNLSLLDLMWQFLSYGGCPWSFSPTDPVHLTFSELSAAASELCEKERDDDEFEPIRQYSF